MVVGAGARVQADDARGLEQLVEVEVAGAELALELGLGGLAGVDDVCAEGVDHLGVAAADAPETDDPDGRAAQLRPR